MTREEYPRPQFVRQGPWQNLNGEWQFQFDDADLGRSAGWAKSGLPQPVMIQVPFVYQAEASGIDDQATHDIVWYERKFSLSTITSEQAVILHFGAVDYFTDVYVNGQFVGHHEGGDTSFEFDITNAIVQDSLQTVVVRVADRAEDETLPRGKQNWLGKSYGIWYTNSTGIWQSVWLEVVHAHHIHTLRLTPDLDHTAIGLAVTASDAAIGDVLSVNIRYQGELVAEDTIKLVAKHTKRDIELFQHRIYRTAYHEAGWTWSPEHPNLFDIELTISAGKTVFDDIQSYFGMRKVSTESGMIFLNNRPYYQRLVLDQGYWPEGLLTAPSDEAFKHDIELAKAAGFNGCRKHQKVEDPRFLYWADHLGYLVWEEVAAVPYYTEASVERLTDAWQATVRRDYNHPSIIMWVPLNESWGVDRIHDNRQQQHFSEALYHLIHALDRTRLVQSNDGWDNTVTDVVAIHNYSHGQDADSAEYQRYKATLAHIDQLLNQAPGNYDIFAKGFHYEGQPIVLSEFGGISFDTTRKDGWGYTHASDEAEFVAQLTRLKEALQGSDCLWGYCYTQLTDVEQEVNGLFTKARHPKIPIEQLKAIFDFEHLGRLDDRVSHYRLRES